jgi:hypothetical protein
VFTYTKFIALIYICFCNYTVSANELRDYLIQKVCVDANGKLLAADPFLPPAGAIVRNLDMGEPLPYYRHDQPMPGLPNGYQRHDSYPSLDNNGNEIIINPFHYGENPGNGYDVYRIFDGWVSAVETQDGGGFISTFFGKRNGTVIPGNGWLFFSSAVLQNRFDTITVTAPIMVRYWEQNGENWPGETPSWLDESSETSFMRIASCPFGGLNGNPVKQIEAIKVVHGYISAPPYGSQSSHDYFLQNGHLEVFYFTKVYGITRWEAWVVVTALGNYNSPSILRDRAINTALRCLPTVAQQYVQPEDLPKTAANRFITATHKGRDGTVLTYALIDVRDWSAITLLPTPEHPPVTPVACQNILKNFHFHPQTFTTSWKRFGNSKEGNLINWSLLQSKATLDAAYNQAGSSGGVRYLATNTGGTPDIDKQAIYQDIPITGLNEGMYTISTRFRSESGTGSMKFVLQQIDHSGNATNDIEVVKTAGETATSFGTVYSFTGNTDNNPFASAVLSSTLASARGNIRFRPDATYLRFLMLPQTANTMHIIDCNVSWAGPDFSTVTNKEKQWFFTNGAEGWNLGNNGAVYDESKWEEGTGHPGGCIILNGSDFNDGNNLPNAWMEHWLDLQNASAATISFDIRAGNLSDNDAAWRVVIRNDKNQRDTLSHWQILKQSDGWQLQSYSLTKFLKSKILFRIEQDDDSEGAGEHIFIDNIEFKISDNAVGMQPNTAVKSVLKRRICGNQLHITIPESNRAEHSKENTIISVYHCNGQLIKQIINKVLIPGEYSFELYNTNSSTAGYKIVRITYRNTQQMISYIQLNR